MRYSLPEMQHDQAIFAAVQPPSDLERILWSDAILAARLFAKFVHEDQFHLAGIRVKANAGPVRDMWMDVLKNELPEETIIQHIPLGITPDRLIGGIDIGRTIAARRKVEMRGMLSLAHQNIVLLPMANLMESDCVAQLTAAIDRKEIQIEREGVSRTVPAHFATIAFDESETDDIGFNSALSDRLMLHIDLSKISLRAVQLPSGQPENVWTEKAFINDDLLAQICNLTTAFGLNSMRPAKQMTELAKAICRMEGRSEVTEADIAIAIRLSLVNRALQIPSQETEKPEDEFDQQPDPSLPDNQPELDPQDMSRFDEIDVDTIESMLPSGLLALLQADQSRRLARNHVGRQGAPTKNSFRGRPLTSREGSLKGRSRLDLIATLRAAAPWQKQRNLGRFPANRIKIRSADFRLRQYKNRTESSKIFAVDASGSTALNRLSEAKGAIEILLGESYVRRDHVSLISFRGCEAEILLPPTRALARAKRSLASLRGGGGTPLSIGLKAALALAYDERKRGREPSIIVMTDGSANIDASGKGGRKKAAEDALQMARQIGRTSIPAILIDVGQRPGGFCQEIAQQMDAVYVPMPFASARKLSQAVQSCS